MTNRRALIFDVPKGNEMHYSKIKGKILGNAAAPLYHAYSYYMPADAFPPQDHASIDATLKNNSEVAMNAINYFTFPIRVWMDLVLAMCSRWGAVGRNRIHVRYVGWARHVWVVSSFGARFRVLHLFRGAQTNVSKNVHVYEDRTYFAWNYPSRYYHRVFQCLE